MAVISGRPPGHDKTHSCNQFIKELVMIRLMNYPDEKPTVSYAVSGPTSFLKFETSTLTKVLHSKSNAADISHSAINLRSKLFMSTNICTTHTHTHTICHSFSPAALQRSQHVRVDEWCLCFVSSVCLSEDGNLSRFISSVETFPNACRLVEWEAAQRC
jgi:hypothetical protein